MLTVRKFGYVVPVQMVDGVPQCHCCQEPMVERDGGWMCAVGSAFLDLAAKAMPDIDRLVLGGLE